MQGAERRKAHARLADRQSGAKDCVKLPARNQADAAGGQIDMCDDAGAAALELDAAHRMPIKRVPSVMDDDICPDMGRMTARWRCCGAGVRLDYSTSLMAGRRLEANFERLESVTRADRRHEPLHGRLGAGVAALAQLPRQACRRQFGEGRNPLAHVIEIGRDLIGPANLARPVGRQLRPRSMYLRIVLGSRPVRRAIAVTDSPWR